MIRSKTNQSVNVIIIIIIIIIIISFNECLLTCKPKNTSVYYKAKTKTQIQHKNSTNTQKQKLNRQKTIGQNTSILKKYWVKNT